MKGFSIERYGAGHYQIHRADLLDILAGALTGTGIEFGSGCVSVSANSGAATATLNDHRQETFDLVVGCDGLHSVVGAAVHGPDTPRFTGNMCWRALIRAESLPPGHVAPQMTIWIGPNGHIVTYYVRGGKLVNLVAFLAVSEDVKESWSNETTTEELIAAYPGVHPDLRMILERTEHCFKWGLFDRDPHPSWSRDRLTLLGDAAARATESFENLMLKTSTFSNAVRRSR
jgi:salicylate hydroxylase